MALKNLNLTSWGCPLEKFQSYARLKEMFLEGRELALIMETPFRAEIGCSKFKEQFDAEELNLVEEAELKFRHKTSGGLLIVVKEDSQLWGFHGIIIN